jgi:hypothetical protein
MDNKTHSVANINPKKQTGVYNSPGPHQYETLKEFCNYTKKHK